MTTLDLMIYALLFILFAVIGAAIINGIFITTRGETVTLPDGSQKDQHAMIFYGFYKFIMAKAGPDQVIYYQREQLRQLVEELKNRGLSPFFMLEDDGLFFEKPSADKEGNEYAIMKLNYDNRWAEWRRQAPGHLVGRDIKITATEMDSGGYLRFYETYPVYRFSKYIRKPLVECLKCMASFWGSVIWWPAVLYFFGYDQVQIPLWIAYMFAVSYFNTLLFYKAK